MTDGPSPSPRPGLDRLVEELRRPLPRPPGAVDGVMRALPFEAGNPSTARPPLSARLWAWMREPRIVLSPLGAAAGVAMVAAAAVFLARAGGETLRDVAEGDGVLRHQFVLVAPDAASVSVVGDFNDWNPAVTPLARTGRDGVWVAEVELGGGRHVYSFVVDGREWVPDPGVPRAPDDEFGRPSSVLLVPAAEGQE